MTVLNVLPLFSSSRFVSTIVDEFQCRFEILWISQLSTRDRRMRASVPRSINKLLPGGVEGRLCPLSPCQLGARDSPLEVVYHAAVVQDDESLIKTSIEIIRMAQNLLPPVMNGCPDV